MAKPACEVTLLSSRTITANGTSSGVCIIPGDYWGALLYLTVGTVTGTSPTLDLYIQQGWTALVAGDTVDGLMITSPAIPSVFDDFAHWTQITGTGNQTCRILAEIGTSAANSPTAAFTVAQDAALGAGIVKAGPLGQAWRVKYVVGGTSPSFAAVSLTAQFVMPQG